MTHGMKRCALASSESKPEHPYIKELQEKREFFQQRIMEDENERGAVYQGYLGAHESTKTFFAAMYYVTDENKAFILIEKDRPWVRQMHEYSTLGVVTMSYYLSFQQKNSVVQKLLKLEFIPTLKDKELAFLERWERVPFNKMALVRYVVAHSLGIAPEQFPQDLVNLIASFMFETEKSLF